jgi:hypothetical protein
MLESLRIFSWYKKERFIKMKLQEIVEEIRD